MVHVMIDGGTRHFQRNLCQRQPTTEVARERSGIRNVDLVNKLYTANYTLRGAIFEAAPNQPASQPASQPAAGTQAGRQAGSQPASKSGNNHEPPWLHWPKAIHEPPNHSRAAIEVTTTSSQTDPEPPGHRAGNGPRREARSVYNYGRDAQPGGDHDRKTTDKI